MKVEFDKSFEKSIDKIRNKNMFPKILHVILELEHAKSIQEVKQIKKLTGYKNYYRIKLGEYRLGIESINNDTVRVIIIAHRKEIYRFFP